MLISRNIYKNYGKLEVLRGIDLQIQRGEVVALVGSSGAGKTTLLQILGTLDLPDKGELWFEDKNIATLKPDQLAAFRNRSLGFVFQFHHLLAEFTALENVMLPAFINSIGKAQATARATELLTEMNLQERIHHRPAAMSGGEQQRVAVARALMNEPSLILADEPTGNLDSKNGRHLFDLFLSLAEKKNVSFLIATHNEEFAASAHRCIRMQDGKIAD